MVSKDELVPPKRVLLARIATLLLGLGLAAGSAEAQFTVNSIGDEADLVPGNGICLTGVATCTLRAAIMESNAFAGTDTIHFNIPGPGPHTINVSAAGLPTITGSVTIDGYTQGVATPNSLLVGNNAVLLIELNGAATGAGVNGLTLNAANTTIRGLVINRFAGYGVQVSATSAAIRGNFVGTNVAGTAAFGNNRDGVGFESGIGLLAGGGGATIGGTAPGDRNLVSGNTNGCARGIELYNSSGNTIQGNYVGTNAAGTAAIANCGGIALDGNPGVGSDNNAIGGTAPGAGNLISGNLTEGIFIQQDSGNNTIQGNIVGLNAAGTVAIPNGTQGITIFAAGNSVGGDAPAKANVIAGNTAQGIRIEGVSATGNALLGNRIYGNGTLGIDLNGDGVTNNDPLDIDGGPNNQLNFPVINAISVVAGPLVVSFSLDVPAGSYRVEFFSNPSGVDIPNGEGEVFAGFRNVTHAGGGSQSFSAAITGVPGDRITATATSCSDGVVCAAFSETSEFSANLIATATLYRSVGITATALAGGAANVLTISGSTASFASALPNNIGVGDVIQYDSDGNASIDALAFIYGRTNSQTYTVRDKNGAAPIAIALDNDWAVYRAYTSLSSWEAQDENLSINVTLRNFDMSTDLVTANTAMYVACYGDGADTTPVTVAGWITGINNYIRIYTPYRASEVGTSQRHSGVWDDTKYKLDVANNRIIDIAAAGSGPGNVWIDGLQLNLVSTNSNGQDAINIDQTSAAHHRISNNIIRATSISHSAVFGIYLKDAAAAPAPVVRIWNNIIYGFNAQANNTAIYSDGDFGAAFVVYAYNNTVYDCQRGYFKNGPAAGPFILKNNIAYNNTDNYDAAGSTFDASSTNNLSGPGADAQMPPAGARNGVTVTFVLPGGSPPNFHLAPGDAGAQNFGANLSADPNLAVLDDIDGQVRQVPWDIGADDATATTAVQLTSFVAVAGDAAVTLSWQTVSEINNLGFYLYRAESGGGPFERITRTPIPGLGSSPVGARYRHLDQGLVNGRTYYYLLEDYETTGKTERHGPVSATPQAGAASGGGSEPATGGSPGPSRITYGNPESNALRVLERTGRGLLLELTTGGFFAEPLPDGSVRLFVPGFVEENSPGSPAVPTRRAWLEAVAGRRVRLTSVRALDVAAFSSLRPLASESRELVTLRGGTVEARRRRVVEGVAFRKARLYPEQTARILETAFQGETKKALLELAPLRWNPASQRLLLARRLLVRLAFTGREPGEHSRGGSRGRKDVPRATDPDRAVLARLGTQQQGLHAVRFEELFDRRRRGLDTGRLRLSRRGDPVAFHVEPDLGRFGPGSSLYFLSDGSSLNPYGAEAVYELELDRAAGLAMPTGSAAPGIPSLGSYLHRIEREENLAFAAQFDVENLWAWAAILASSSKSVPFAVSRLAPGIDTAKLDLWLLGLTADTDAVENHVRIFVNGQLVAEPTWNSRSLELLSVEFSPTLLQEGPNTLAIENTRSAYAVVLLDRFALSYPRLAAAEAGVLEGSFPLSGTAEVSGFNTTPILLDLSEASPRWLTGMECSPGSCRFRAEAGRRYLAAEAALRPSIELASPGWLKSTLNRYDYLVLAPRAFLETAEPLLQHRRNQGLASAAVAIEDVFDAFGFGEPNPQAIRDFLAYAFHHWAAPAPRYVLLLGDGTYDYKDYLKTGVSNQVPPILFKSSYIWTASDSLYAAVNGEDALPDLAIGRLPASTVEEARTLVDKILAFETAGHTLDGPAVVISDNPDRAGDFEAQADEIAATLLAGHNPSRISLAQLGTDTTRAAILGAFDQGPALVSYIGHGGVQLWAHENIFDTSQIASLAPQSQLPLVLTINCLNGYFHSPYSDSLAEELVKAEAKGAIAAFSPSGLSLNDAAGVFHRALLTELTGTDHERLGDAVLAAQAAYADSGALPELIGIFHLFGDPALRIR